jgi:hypothetical protein
MQPSPSARETHCKRSGADACGFAYSLRHLPALNLPCSSRKAPQFIINLLEPNEILAARICRSC